MELPHISSGSYYKRISFAVAVRVFAEESHTLSLV